MTEVKTILSATADTILEKPVRVDVEVLHPRWWEKIAMKVKLMPAKRSFMIRPATLGNMIRISQLLLGVDVDVYKTASALDANYQMISAHGRTLARVIAIAITNNEQEPSDALIQFIIDNLTARELLAITGVVIRQLDVGNFMTTIVSIRGRNILETSQKTQGS